MGVKISQLASLSEITSQDVLIINHNSATYQGNLDTIIGGYLDSASYINASNFSDYLFSSELSLGYFSSFVTQDYLYSQSYISYNDLFSSSGGSGYLGSYITAEYLSSYCSNYITSEYCSSYITSEDLSGYLSSYCSSYITSEYLDSYCSSYITSEYLSSASYMTYNDVSNYLSNGSYMTYSDVENSFSTFMNSGYLSDASNAYQIYVAISSYFNT